MDVFGCILVVYWLREIFCVVQAMARVSLGSMTRVLIILLRMTYMQKSVTARHPCTIDMLSVIIERWQWYMFTNADTEEQGLPYLKRKNAA